MKTFTNAVLATAFLFAANPALADSKRTDDVAKSVINAYVLFQELPGAFPGGSGQKPSREAVCLLTGAAVAGFLLLDGRSDQEIAVLLGWPEDTNVATLRERVITDATNCGKAQ